MAEDRRYRPPLPTESAASAALRLVEEPHDDVVRRDRSDGGIEVVGVKDGRVEHYVVHRDGTIELVAARGPWARHTWGRRIRNAGLAGFLIILVAGFVFQPRADNLGWMLAVGFVAAIGGSALISRKNLEAYLRDRTGSDESWTDLPHELGGWPARSSPQLEAAKELSDQGDGSAYVRNREEGLVEVVTTRKGSSYTHLVDQDGGIVAEDRGPVAGDERWGLRLAVGGSLLFIASLPMWDVSILVGAAGAVVLVASWTASGLLEARHRRRRAGKGWFRLQTTVTD